MDQAVKTVYQIVSDFSHTSLLVPCKEMHSYENGVHIFVNHYDSIANTWQIQHYRNISKEDEGYRSEQPLGDFMPVTFGGNAIGLRRRALELLSDYMKTFGELLPCVFHDQSGLAEPFSIFRPLKRIDAIDHEKTIGGNRYGNGRVGSARLSLVQDRLIDGVFCLLAEGIHCTDEFKDLVERDGLSGICFHPIWSVNPEVQRRIMDWELRVGLKLPPIESSSV